MQDNVSGALFSSGCLVDCAGQHVSFMLDKKDTFVGNLNGWKSPKTGQHPCIFQCLFPQTLTCASIKGSEASN